MFFLRSSYGMLCSSFISLNDLHHSIPHLNNPNSLPCSQYLLAFPHAPLSGDASGSIWRGVGRGEGVHEVSPSPHRVIRRYGRSLMSAGASMEVVTTRRDMGALCAIWIATGMGGQVRVLVDKCNVDAVNRLLPTETSLFKCYRPPVLLVMKNSNQRFPHPLPRSNPPSLSPFIQFQYAFFFSHMLPPSMYYYFCSFLVYLWVPIYLFSQVGGP